MSNPEPVKKVIKIKKKKEPKPEPVKKVIKIKKKAEPKPEPKKKVIKKTKPKLPPNSKMIKDAVSRIENSIQSKLEENNEDISNWLNYEGDIDLELETYVEELLIDNKIFDDKDLEDKIYKELKKPVKEKVISDFKSLSKKSKPIKIPKGDKLKKKKK